MMKSSPTPYDHLFKEAISEAMEGFLQTIIGVEMKVVETLSPDLTMTLDREPDFIVRVREKDKSDQIVHLEFQMDMRTKMMARMLFYAAMIFQIFKKLPIQFVIYLGNGKPKPPTAIASGLAYFNYHLIDIKEIPAEKFLNSRSPNLVVLSLLGKHNDPIEVLKRIQKRLKELNLDELTQQKSLNQITICSQLRKFGNSFNHTLENMALTLDITENFLFQKGEHKGKLEGKLESEFDSVHNIRQSMGLNAGQIANILKLEVEFVEKILAAKSWEELL